MCSLTEASRRSPDADVLQSVVFSALPVFVLCHVFAVSGTGSERFASVYLLSNNIQIGTSST